MNNNDNQTNRLISNIYITYNNINCVKKVLIIFRIKNIFDFRPTMCQVGY